MSATFASLVDMLRARAADMPDRRAYTFLADGEIEAATLTYAELDRMARTIAGALQERGLHPGDRALLVYPPGLDFIAAFFGALYAGVIAVPCYPPHPAQVTRTLPRMLGIVADCAPAIVLAPDALVQLAPRLAAVAPRLAAVPWLATDVADADAPWQEADVPPDGLAFLQYTSGSTSTPRGVMVSHANLLHNLAYADFVEANDSTSVSVSWLPVIHDMGLIEGVLEPVFGGYPAVLMSPAAFLQRPLRWLRAIDRYRATNSGGPNFAYDLCVRKITEQQRASLDLSSWRVAYNGAEPVRAQTLRTFHAAFRDCGFRWSTFYPAYGLAEATLVVSSGRRDSEPVATHVDAAALGRGRFTPPCTPGSARRELVSSGRPAFGTAVRIVDPDSRRPTPPGQIGEIWVSSPSVACGYWGRPEDSDAIFRARIAGEPGTAYLRTGDLGQIDGGELFVTGRLKDLLIIRGVKYYPQDLELTAELAHPALRPGSAAAFAIPSVSEDVAVLVIEADLRRLRQPRGPDAGALPRQPESGALQDVIARVREAVLLEHGIALHRVALLAAGTIPKTTSGKIRRHACAHAWAAGTLTVLASSPIPAGLQDVHAGAMETVA